MRVLFSNPPWFTDDQTRWGVRAGSRWPFTGPAGMAYLPFPFLMAGAAAFVKAQGHNVWLADSVATRESEASWRDRLREGRFDYIILETSTPSIEVDLAFAREAAAYGKVVLSGPHATVFAREILEANPHVFAVLQGEYEQGAARLLREGRPGIYPLELVEDMDRLPAPLRDSTIYRYNDRFPNTPEGPCLQVVASRGCPFGCIFCLWPQVMFGGRRYRPRSAGAVLAEIEDCLRRFPRFTSLYFDDDTFNIGKPRMLELCRGLSRLGLPWSAMCRADTSDAETWRAMRDSGCYAVKLGLESGCQTLVDRCRKGLDLEKVRDTVALLKSLGIFVHVTYTWGLPGETPETIEETKRFHAALAPDSWQESVCTPFPGTDFYRLYAEVNGGAPRDWASYDGARPLEADADCHRLAPAKTSSQTDSRS